MPTPCTNIIDYFFTGDAASVNWTSDIISLLFSDTGNGWENDNFSTFFSGSGDESNWTSSLNSFEYSGSGNNHDWDNNPFESLYSGSGFEVNWDSSNNYFFTGNGENTDWCDGGRTISSFDGGLSVDLLVSRSYQAVVNPTYYKVVVINSVN